MKKYSIAIFSVFCCILSGMLTACNSDGDYSATYTYEGYISAVQMGSLKRIVHTKSSTGEDSTYNLTVNGALYPLYIDQLNDSIYNVDSLPYGTDLSKVTFTNFTYQGALISIKLLTEDADTLFSYTDSTDFREPRYISVHIATPETTIKRTYKVTLSVHKEEADSFAWTKATTNADLAAFVEQRAMMCGDSIWVFGRKSDGNLVKLSAHKNQTDTWLTAKLNRTDIDVRSIQLKNDTLFAVTPTAVVRAFAQDAAQWTPLTANLLPDNLFAASDTELYALQSGDFYGSKDGLTWTKQTVSGTGVMPTSNIAGICMKSRKNAYLKYILLTGENGTDPALWRRDDYSGKREAEPWFSYLDTETDETDFPKLMSPSLSIYNSQNDILLTGISTTTNAIEAYVSKDYGYTWMADGFVLPATTVSGSTASVVDAENYDIWLFCNGSGEIWRGRQNGTSWIETQTNYYKARKR